MKKAVFQKVVLDIGDSFVGHIQICDHQGPSYKRGGLPQGWSLKGGTT